MRMRFLLATALFFAACSVAAAQPKWTEYRYAEQAFAVQFPGAPRVKSKTLEAKTPVTHFEALFADARNVYDVSVMAFAGPGPSNPGPAYLSRVIATYAKGSGSTVRTQNPATVAGQPGMTAVADDEANNRYHAVDAFVRGARIYLIVSVGPKGHETSAEAKRFRQSFKLIEK